MDAPGWPFSPKTTGRMSFLWRPWLFFSPWRFFWPTARFLYLSVDNGDLVENLPKTMAALSDWKRADGLPGEEVFSALVQDLARAHVREKRRHRGPVGESKGAEDPVFGAQNRRHCGPGRIFRGFRFGKS